MAELLVFFGCDVEMDDPEQGWPYWASRWDRRRPVLKWRSVTEGVPRIVEAVEGLGDSRGRFRMTFFVKVDEQFRELTGSATFIFERFPELWNGLDAGRFDIGWHPHLYRWQERLRSWSTELEDTEWIRGNLEGSYAALVRIGRRPKVTRLDGVHHPVILRTLDGLGIVADSSAYPGEYRMAFNRWRNAWLRGIKVNVCFDWRGAPDRTYHPSAEDHRREGGLRLLEIPMTSYRARHPVFGWRRYLTPWKFFSDYAGQEEFLERMFRRVRESGEDLVLVTKQHSSDIVRGVEAKFFRNDIRNIRKNWERLRRFSDRYGVAFRCVGLEELAGRGPGLAVSVGG